MSLTIKRIGEGAYLYFDGSHHNVKFSFNAGPIKELKSWVKAKILYDTYFELKREEEQRLKNFKILMNKLIGKEEIIDEETQKVLHIDIEEELRKLSKDFDEYIKSNPLSGNIDYETVCRLADEFIKEKKRPKPTALIETKE